MDDKMILECEADAPENWETNVILTRNAMGVVQAVEVPDDEEVDDNAVDDQA